MTEFLFYWTIFAVVGGFAYLWGYWDGVKRQLDIMKGHFQEGMSFDHAIGYEETNHKREDPHA